MPIWASAPMSRLPMPDATRRKALLFVVPTLQGGGAERVLVTLLRHLDRSQFDLALAVVDTRDMRYRNDVPDDVEFIDLARRRVRGALPAILSLIRRRRPDVVFSVIGHLNLAVALMKPLLPATVAIVARETAPISESLRAASRGPLVEAILRRLYARFDTIVCQSRVMQRELVTRMHVRPARIAVIRNPVDVARIAGQAFDSLPSGMNRGAEANPDDIELVSAGRLGEEKGFDILIEALALLNDSRYRLTILGEGPLRADLERLAARLGVAERVWFAGFQHNPYAFFARARVFVLSSRWDAFPNVVLEALACGTPVVATPAQGGIRELLEDQPECLIADDLTATALARAIASRCAGGLARIRLPAKYAADAIAREYAVMFATAHAGV